MTTLVQDNTDTHTPALAVRVVGAGLVLYLAAQFYLWCLGVDPPDFDEFLVPWYQEIVSDGRVAVFAEPFSNYSPPYLYLLSAASLFDGIASPATIIRGLSVAIMIALAVTVFRFVRVTGSNQPLSLTLAAGLFLLPSLVINAVMLGQCDALWAAPCLMAVLAATQRKAAAMMIWCGIAFAIKAQAMFIAPFALGAMIALRPKWWVWLLPAAAWIACMVPAMIAGWPLSHLLTIYLGQAQHFAGLVSVGGPNPWLLLDYFSLDQSARDMPIAYGLAAAGGLATTLLTWAAMRSEASTAAVVRLALLSALILPFFLPMMHARYFLLADVLAILLWTIERTPRNFAIALAVQIGSAGGLMAFISSEAAYYVGDANGFANPVAPLPVFGVAAVIGMSIAVMLVASDAWQNRRQLPSR
jgi:Gpi18-like mannosyltransferase